MAQKILIKKSAVADKVPTDAQLDVGELAVNTADALLYTKHSDGSIKLLSPTMDERSKIADSVSSSDARLTNSREWTGATVSQAEAEAGTASTRRAWTSQRVRQAINAWWQLVTSGFGRNLVSASNEAAARNALQLTYPATASTVGDGAEVMRTRAYGLGDVGTHSNYPTPTSLMYDNFWGGNCIVINSSGAPYASMLIMEQEKISLGSINDADGIWAAEVITDKNQVVLGKTAATAREALEIGKAMPTTEATVDTLSLGTVIYVDGTDSECVLKGLPSLDTEPTHARWWNIRTDGVANRTTQYASEVYGVGTIKGRAFTRVKHDAVWSVWREMLVEGSHGIGERGNPSVPASSGLAYNSFLGGNTLVVNSTGDYVSFLVMQENGVQIGSNTGGVAWSANIWHSANQLALGTTPKSARQALELVDEGDGWVDLRPYLQPPFYWDTAREGKNPHPRIRKLPSGRVELDGAVSWNEIEAAPQHGVAFRVPPEFRPVHTSAGVSFVDSTPLYFGTGQWLMTGEVEYAANQHGDMMLILGHPPNPSQGIFGLNGVGWYMD